MTHSYGRQWFHPCSGKAFHTDFLKADKMAMEGHTITAINIYNSMSSFSPPARRRIRQAKRQAQTYLRFPERKEEIRISFIDWYSNFSSSDLFISQLLNSVDLPWKETCISDADLVIAGCYGNEIHKNQQLLDDKLVLFISGENLLPSYDIHDFSLTTLPDSFCDKNFRYPQWYGEVDFKNTKSPSLTYANKPLLSYERDLKFSAIYNNSTPQREEQIFLLKQFFGDQSVHIYGSHRGNEVDKIAILARTKINICFENSIGNGYCTEKLLHALSLGCNALYWGDPSFSRDFKSTNVLNLYESDQDSLIEWCRQRLAATRQGPMLTALPINDIVQSEVNLKPVANHVRKWLKLILNFRSPLLT